MPKLTFFPLGNADCCLIELSDGRTLLFDYANTKDESDKSDLRIDLPSALRNILKGSGRDFFDVVVFTHLDLDHIKGSSEFFFFEHASKYQTSGRIKIREMWVPSAAITEIGIEEEGRIVRAEARHRLLKGSGIRVFSRPNCLEDWLKTKNIALKDREELIVDAGRLISGYSKIEGKVELFVHSPFASRQDDGTLVTRNNSAIGVQFTFFGNSSDTKVFMGADLEYEALEFMVKVTNFHKNQSRLEWDVFKIPHHCSYGVLSSEKGDETTEPTTQAKELLEDRGRKGGLLVSTSKAIPNDDSKQPPHRQAANYYKNVAKKLEGKFVVTMEHPNVNNPEPLVILIDDSGATIEKKSVTGISTILARSAPRAG